MATSRIGTRDIHRELHQMIASYAQDPLGFVEHCYRWPIHGEAGPDAFQRDFLARWGQQIRDRRYTGIESVPPIRMGMSTGHSVGKTALCAWIVHFVLSTRPHCRITVTANTADQLEKKSWAAVREWYPHLINAFWFEVNAAVMFRQGYRATWFAAPASCAEENSEAFAGQHARGSASCYVFDEASAVPDKIWEVAEGGLSDEAMIFAFGNPTRNTGRFHHIAFGSQRERWDIRVVDARESKFSNKAIIAEWLDEYGESSDFFRVRVRGLPPAADELQYIDAARIAQAQTNMPYIVAGEPLIAGVDVSGGGSAWTVCRFRQGFDARSIKPIRLTGEQTVRHERQLVIDTLANALTEHPITAMFVDSAYGAPIVDRLRQMGFKNVHEVNFGGPSSDAYCENARAAMYRACKDWLPRGAIDQQDHRLATDLSAPGFHLNKKNKLVIESKAEMQRRGVASPDDADALVLTWAMPVRVARRQPRGWATVSPSPFA